LVTLVTFYVINSKFLGLCAIFLGFPNWRWSCVQFQRARLALFVAQSK